MTNKQKEEVIQEMKDGAVLGVSWAKINEMLGLQKDNELECAIYENNGNFIPRCRRKFIATEGELVDILHAADVNWMADDYDDAGDGLLGRTSTRFFCTKDPNRIRWMPNPNKYSESTQK